MLSQKRKARTPSKERNTQKVLANKLGTVLFSKRKIPMSDSKIPRALLYPNMNESEKDRWLRNQAKISQLKNLILAAKDNPEQQFSITKAVYINFK